MRIAQAVPPETACGDLGPAKISLYAVQHFHFHANLPNHRSLFVLIFKVVSYLSR